MSASPSWLKRTRLTVERALVLRLLRQRWLTSRLGRKHRAPVDGRTLDPQLAAMMELDERRGPLLVERYPPHVARRKMAAAFALLDLDPVQEVDVRPVEVAGAAGRLGARLYTPHGLADRSPLVVFFHGGGMVTLNLDSHDAFCRYLAHRARVRVISVDYRLAPEHPYPAPTDDALAAFYDIAARASEWNADPARLAVMGDSAGGTLSAVVAQRSRQGPAQPALQVLIYPAVELTGSFPSHRLFAEGYLLTRATIDWFMNHYLPPGVDRRHPDASPLFREDVSGVAPALVYTAGFDPLRDEGRAYAEKLSSAGVRVQYREFETQVHGFILMAAALDSARAGVARIADDVAEALRG